MQPRRFPLVVSLVLCFGLFVDAKQAASLGAEGAEGHHRAPAPLNGPPLPFGAELECTFPEAFAAIAEKESCRAIAAALGNALESSPIACGDCSSARNERPTWKALVALK